MASQTIRDRIHNVIGNRREDIGTITASDDTGEVRTRLYFIESLSVYGTINQGSNIAVWKNSMSASSVEDDPGWFHFSDPSGASPGSQEYQFMAIGW